MKNKYEGMKTEDNLWEAFCGESKARNKYTYFASVAKKEGYEQMAELFLKTADNEKEHAKLWFKALDQIEDTPTNLLRAAEAEKQEWVDMYERMAREADEEGFHDLADQFRGVAAIEKCHEKRYRNMLLSIEQDMVYRRDEPVVWYCRNCGHVEIGTEAPSECPVCKHSRAYFQVIDDNVCIEEVTI